MKPSVYRREKILRCLGEHSFATVSRLARELDCSQMTIRRDLARLESEGLLERSHGGATATRRIRPEFALGEKTEVFREEKTAIGRAAAVLIRPGERVLIDTGSTTLALARELRTREGISVVTTSLLVVSVLLSALGIECMLFGGIVRESSPDLYGPLLEWNLSRIHPDRAFIGCDGVSVDGGLTTSGPRVARASALMIENSGNVALLADSSKAESDSFVTFTKMEDIDVLITDDAMPGDILDAARASGVETIIVTPTRQEKGA